MNNDYNRGFYAGIDKALNLINTIEEQGQDFRSILYKELMNSRPTEDYDISGDRDC